MHAAAANRVDTRATHGWSAQRWTDALRQEVSVALQIANARLLAGPREDRVGPRTRRLSAGHARPKGCGGRLAHPNGCLGLGQPPTAADQRGYRCQRC